MMQARDAKEMNLIHRFVDQQGVAIRVQGSYENPWFCLKYVCGALGIANHRNKARLLQDRHKQTSTQYTSGQNRQMTFVSEAGLYRIIFSCRESNIPGTAPFAFTNWITDEVLPSIRKNGIYELKQEVLALKDERGRRLWNVVKLMDNWSFNIRRKYFSSMCIATKHICYVDEFDSPHVHPDKLQEVRTLITLLVSARILAEVPVNQRSITDYFQVEGK